MNLLEAENKACARFEELLKNAGWRDGWGMAASDIAASSQPFFYRNSTDLDACLTRIRIDGMAKILYLLYTVQGVETAYSGDLPHHFTVTITLYLYTDDPALYCVGTAFHNPYSEYIVNVLDALALNLWTIEDGGEEAVASGDDSIPYLHRHTIYITKLIT